MVHPRNLCKFLGCADGVFFAGVNLSVPLFMHSLFLLSLYLSLFRQSLRPPLYFFALFPLSLFIYLSFPLSFSLSLSLFLSLFSFSLPLGIVEREKVELYSHVPVMRNVLDQLKVRTAARLPIDRRQQQPASGFTSLCWTPRGADDWRRQYRLKRRVIFFNPFLQSTAALFYDTFRGQITWH